MMGKGQCLVLLYSVVQELLGMRIIPLGVKKGRDQRPRWFSNYSFTSINANYLPIAALPTIQYGRYSYHLIREVVIADQDLGPIYVL